MFLDLFLTQVTSALGFTLVAPHSAAREIRELLEKSTPKKVDAIKILRQAVVGYTAWNWDDSDVYTDSVYNAIIKIADANHTCTIGLKEAKDIIEFIQKNLKNFK